MHQDRPHNEGASSQSLDWEDAPSRRCVATTKIWEGAASERCIRPSGHMGRHQVFGGGDKDPIRDFMEISQDSGPISVEGEKKQIAEPLLWGLHKLVDDYGYRGVLKTLVDRIEDF